MKKKIFRRIQRAYFDVFFPQNRLVQIPGIFEKKYFRLPFCRVFFLPNNTLPIQSESHWTILDLEPVDILHQELFTLVGDRFTIQISNFWIFHQNIKIVNLCRRNPVKNLFFDANKNQLNNVHKYISYNPMNIVQSELTLFAFSKKKTLLRLVRFKTTIPG